MMCLSQIFIIDIEYFPGQKMFSDKKNSKSNEFSPPRRAYFVRCPYDNRHFVLIENFENHLKECAKNNANIEVMFCPFNTKHRCRSMDALVR